jgi:hypothetical protein
MSLNGMLSTAEDRTLGFDCNQVLTPAQVAAFLADGYKFVFRYIPRVARAIYDLTPDEAQMILDAGMGLGIVQHVAGEGWDALADKGRLYGSTAAAQATELGFPKGMCVWCDLEGVDATDSDEQVIAYCDEWHRMVNGAGYNAGLYVGWRTLLSGAQIHDLPFRHYWSAFNLNIDEVPTVRGVQIKQGREKVAHGVKFDPDVASADLIGERAWFFWPQPQ